MIGRTGVSIQCYQCNCTWLRQTRLHSWKASAVSLVCERGVDRCLPAAVRKAAAIAGLSGFLSLCHLQVVSYKALVTAAGTL